MAIFIIGVKNINNDKYFRLYNTKAKENNIRDISEKDLMYLMRGNSNFTLENAEVKDGKIAGTTGSLNKIENGICYTILGSYSVNGEEAGYIYIDTMGNLYENDKISAVKHLQGMPIQNASIVNGQFIRGINWTIPNIKDKNVVDKAKGNTSAKPIYLHVDVNLINYNFSKYLRKEITRNLFPEDYLEKEQFLVFLENCMYSTFVPNEISYEFEKKLRENKINCLRVKHNEKVDEVRILYMNKGFKTDFEIIKEIANSLNAYLRIELVRSKNPEHLEYYDCQVRNIVSDAEGYGLKMKKYFFLGNNALVAKNLKGYLMCYVERLDYQLSTICKNLDIEYRATYKGNNKDDLLRLPFQMIDYAPLDGKPYACILMEMGKAVEEED